MIRGLRGKCIIHRYGKGGDEGTYYRDVDGEDWVNRSKYLSVFGVADGGVWRMIPATYFFSQILYPCKIQICRSFAHTLLAGIGLCTSLPKAGRK